MSVFDLLFKSFKSHPLSKLEKICHYRFRNLPYLEQAFTYRSLSSLPRKNYERLEFLGDRVLGLVIAERLLNNFPEESEGELARRYAALVSMNTLADVARRIQLASHVKFSRGEEAQNGADNSANLADTCAAVIGAVYLDGGIEEARTFIEREWAELIRVQEKPPRDPKTGLQEWTQARALGLPRYDIISQGGPAHSPTFTIEVHVQGFSPATGQGKSKRYAERLAAEQMLARLFDEGLIEKRG